MSFAEAPIRDLRALVPPGAADRALQAGLASVPPRLLDPLFHERRALHLDEALEACGRTSSESTEAAAVPDLLGDEEIGHLVVFEARPDIGRWLRRPAHKPSQATLVASEEGRLRAARKSLGDEVSASLILGELREGVRHAKLEIRGARTIAWVGHALGRHPPEVAMHLLRHVGACLTGSDRLLVAGPCMDGGQTGIGSEEPAEPAIQAWADSVLGGINGLEDEPWVARWVHLEDGEALMAHRASGEDMSHPLAPGHVIPGGAALELARIHRWSDEAFEGVVSHAGLRLESVHTGAGHRVAVLRR